VHDAYKPIRILERSFLGEGLKTLVASSVWLWLWPALLEQMCRREECAYTFVCLKLGGYRYISEGPEH